MVTLVYVNIGISPPWRPSHTRCPRRRARRDGIGQPAADPDAERLLRVAHVNDRDHLLKVRAGSLSPDVTFFVLCVNTIRRSVHTFLIGLLRIRLNALFLRTACNPRRGLIRNGITRNPRGRPTANITGYRHVPGGRVSRKSIWAAWAERNGADSSGKEIAGVHWKDALAHFRTAFTADDLQRKRLDGAAQRVWYDYELVSEGEDAPRAFTE